MLRVTLAVAESRMKSVMRVKSRDDRPRISATAFNGMMRRRKSRVKGGVRRKTADIAASIKYRMWEQTEKEKRKGTRSRDEYGSDP